MQVATCVSSVNDANVVQGPVAVEPYWTLMVPQGVGAGAVFALQMWTL